MSFLRLEGRITSTHEALESAQQSPARLTHEDHALPLVVIVEILDGTTSEATDTHVHVPALPHVLVSALSDVT